jgi:hypothetical protein
MARWRVEIPSWSTEVEADDEGDALIQADVQFNFMSEAQAVEEEEG